jgi:hypothetical protein
MASFPWNAATARTTGIAASNDFANATGLLSNEIDNSTNLDDTLDVELAFTPEAAPTANVVFYIYLLSAIDGTNYEDGGTALQPTAKLPIASIACRAAATAQKVAVSGITIPPGKFKLLVWNATAVQHDAMTLLAYTYRKGYAA